MSDSMTPEKPHNTEIQGQTAFDRLQAFLNEKGEVVAQRELQYIRPNLYFLTKLSFGGIAPELLKNYVDVSISQKQPESTGSPPADIEVTLAHRGQRKLGSPRVELSVAARTSKIVITNPLSGRPERVILEPFDPLGRLLKLSKKQWQEVKDDSGEHYVTTNSEQEVSKIVDVLTKMNEESLRIGKTAPEPLTSRRGFIRTLVIGAKLAAFDTLLAHMPLVPSLSKEFWEQLETATFGVPLEELRREIEGRFNIEILAPSTGVREVEYSGERMFPTVEWDSPRLKMLVRTLAELPSHFYSSRKVGEEERKLRIALVDSSPVDLNAESLLAFIALGGFCKCSGDKESPTVVLVKQAIGVTFPESIFSRETVVHEFTHAVTSPELDRYIKRIAVPVGLENILQFKKALSPITIRTSKGIIQTNSINPYPKNWTVYTPNIRDWDKSPQTIVVDKDKLTLGDEHASSYNEGGQEDHYLIFHNRAEQKVLSKSRLIRLNPDWYVVEEELNRYGEEFFRRPYQEYLAKTRDVEEYGGNILPVGIPTKGVPFVDTGLLIYGTTNFSEFFSVAAMFYIRGHDGFVGTYEPFLGKEKSEKLYEGMKQEIFRGKEY